MFSGRFTRATLHALDWLTDRIRPPNETAEHLQIGQRGEEDAYFYLRRLGYTFITLNYRSPNHRGEIDLIGWDGEVLCFVEVKTRTTRDVKPAEAAVDREKQRELRLVASDFVRHMPCSCQWRFDVVAVYYDHGFKQPAFELFQNAFPVAYNRGYRQQY